MKRITAIILLAAMLLALAGCTGSDMPYNEEISFHNIGLTIPGSFIRDSTQSSADTWVFERGFYRESIILMRHDLEGEARAQLEAYAQTMMELTGNSVLTTFAGVDAVRTSYTRDGEFCQELLFAYAGSSYAIALRGGTAEDFEALLATLTLVPQSA